MDTHLPMLLPIITILLTTLPLSQGEEEDHYRACNTTYSCGNLTSISYPFWGQNRPRYCGISDMWKLNCDKNGSTTIEIGSQSFTVLWINQFNFTMRLRRRDLVSTYCPSGFTNTALNPPVFSYNPEKVENLTLFYNCQNVSDSLPRDFKNRFMCQNQSGGNEQVFYIRQTRPQEYHKLPKCGAKVQVPVLRDVTLGDVGGIEALKQLLEHGFDVVYYHEDFRRCIACNASEGMCGSGIHNTSLFSCHCRDGAGDLMCPTNGMISVLFSPPRIALQLVHE